LLFIYLFSLVGSGGDLPKEYKECYTGATVVSRDTLIANDNIEVSSRLFELIFGKGNSDGKDVMLYPGGSAFGLMIKEDGVTVLGSSTCRALLAGDRIVMINGKEIDSAEDVEAALLASGGKRLEIDVIRCGERLRISVTPRLVDGKYTLGVTLRSQTAGIGTVTFIDPETNAFGGLGHGVSDASGGYITVKEGAVCSVTLGGCKRGEVGHAGELTGVLKQTKLGTIDINSECGVFGTLDTLPDYCDKPLPAAKRGEVKCGAAEIISTVKNGKRATYGIEIYDIDQNSHGSKSFKIKVTDPTLIAITGGIVRGMSGSPIIQDGKLVGAVTHVMVANPTEGYGIFIENMLNAATQNQVQPKAA